MGELALLFNLAFYYYTCCTATPRPAADRPPGVRPGAAARQAALEFLTGYVVENALSVDNIFVFVLVFCYFGVPPR